LKKSTPPRQRGRGNAWSERLLCDGHGFRSAGSSVPILVLLPRQGHKHQRHAECRDVPDQRPDKRRAISIEREISEPGHKIENRTGFGERVVAPDGIRREDQSREHGKALGKIAQSSVESPGDTRERRHTLIPCAGRPAITTLKAGRVRSGYDVHESEHHAANQHAKFDVQASPPRAALRHA